MVILRMAPGLPGFIDFGLYCALALIGNGSFGNCGYFARGSARFFFLVCFAFFGGLFFLIIGAADKFIYILFRFVGQFN